MSRAIAVRRACGVATAALLVLAVACADKVAAPAVALSPRFNIRVTTTAPRTTAAQKLFVAAGFITPPQPGDDPGDSLHVLDLATVDVSGGAQEVNLKVDLTPCLADPLRHGSRDACSLYIVAILHPSTFDVDTSSWFSSAYDYRILGPYDATPGHPPTVPAIDLSTSSFAVNHWEADESLRLGGSLTPASFTGPITGAVSATGPATLFALTLGQVPTSKPDSTFYGSVLGVFQNGTWRRVVGRPGGTGVVPFFLDVAAFSPTDAYLAANDGVGLYHYDGTAITAVAGVQQSLRSVAVSSASPNARYLIAGTGSGGGVWVSNLTTFTRYSLPGLTQVELVCINSATEAFATSRANNSSIYRFDGTNWTSVPTTITAGKVDLQCLGPGQVYVATGGNPGTLHRWNGSGWTPLSGPPGATGRAMNWAVVSANEMYAVGDSANVNRAFYRFDGTSWREVGRLAFTTSFSQNRVWADPRGGAAYVSSTQLGAAARVELVTPTSASVLSYQPQLRDVAMPTPTSAFVVGANFFLGRWNGARWSVDAPPAGTATNATLNGVWADGPGNAWVVGRQSTIVRWDGVRWNLLSDSARSVVFPRDNFNAAWGAGGSVWIVGDGSIVRCSSATNCATDPQSGGGALYGVWGTSATNIYAVGAAGRILRFDGTSWTSMSSPTRARLSRVAGSSANDVWAAGDTVMLHFDGSTWKVVTTSRDVPNPAGYQSPAAPQIGLWAASAREAYYGSWKGRILRGGGPDWGENPFAFQGNANVVAIAGAPGGCALAAGDPDRSTTAGAPILLRGVGPTGCLGAPMTAPASWP